MSDLSPHQQNAVCDLFTALSAGLSTSLSEQINHITVVEQPKLEMVSIVDLLQEEKPTLYTTFSLSPPMEAESLFLITEEAAGAISELLAGNDGKAPPVTLGEDEVGLLTGAMGGVITGLAAALSERSGDVIEVESSTTHLGTLSLPPAFALADTAARVTLSLSITELLDTEISFLFAPETVRTLFPDNDVSSGDSELSEEDLARMLGEVSGGIGAPSTSAPVASGSAAPSTFTNFAGGSNETMMPRGMDLIMDIPLEVSVELGRVRMLIKDVLELGSGAIVELDRVAGEPVDLLVNGRLIAKGEVVVIEDNFGIRVTEIISPADRLVGLGKGR